LGINSQIVSPLVSVGLKAAIGQRLGAVLQVSCFDAIPCVLDGPTRLNSARDEASRARRPPAADLAFDVEFERVPTAGA
jgi:hypothetical protein